MRRALRCAAGGLLAILAAGPLVAQEANVVDIGVASVRFPLDDRVILGPWVRAAAQRDVLSVTTNASGSLIVSPGGLSGAADAGASWRRLLGGAVSVVLDAEGSALFGQRTGGSGGALGGARLERGLGRDAGAWVRTAGHISGRESGLLHGYGVEAAAWWRVRGATLVSSLTGERAQGQLFVDPPPSTGGIPHAIAVVPVRYVEGTVGATLAPAWGQLELVGGARRDPDAAQRLEAVWSVSALAWRSPTRAITFSVARQPDDFIHGADAMLSLSIGMRYGARRPPAPAAVGAAPIAVVVEGVDAARRLRIQAAGARVVELMADFTDWEAVTLVPADGGFLYAAGLTPGTHRVLVRLDGGPWRVPHNLPAVDDDLGGRVGLLAVP